MCASLAAIHNALICIHKYCWRWCTHSAYLMSFSYKINCTLLQTITYVFKTVIDYRKINISGDSGISKKIFLYIRPSFHTKSRTFYTIVFTLFRYFCSFWDWVDNFQLLTLKVLHVISHYSFHYMCTLVSQI